MMLQLPLEIHMMDMQCGLHMYYEELNPRTRTPRTYSSAGSTIPYLPTRAAKSTHLPTLIVILPSIVLRVFQRQLHLRQHEIVGFVLAGMSSHDETLQRVVFPGRLFSERQPLHGETGPLQRMRDDQIVKERRILLPNLVLLVHQPLLHLVSQFLFLLRHRLRASFT